MPDVISPDSGPTDGAPSHTPPSGTHASHEELQVSAARYRALAMASSDVIYRMSPDWQEMHHLDGRGFLADLLEPSRTWWEAYILPEDQPQVAAVIEEAVRTGTPFEFEHRVRQADGSVGWTHSRAVPIRDEQGTVVEWVGAARDVTERKQAEEQLRQSEERYRTLFETMGQGYCDLELIRDAQGRAVDQRYLELNPAFERVFGIPASDARGRTASEIFPALEPWWHEAFARIAQRGVPERIDSAVASLGRWFEVFAYPRGGDRLTVLYEDVTARKQAEDVLRQSDERQRFLLRLSDALRSLTDPIAMQGEAARILGEHLGLSRVFYAPVEPGREGDDFVIHHEFCAPGAASIVGRFPVSGLGEHLLAEVQAGRTVVADDLETQTLLTPAELEIYVAFDAYAYVAVPLVKGGRFAALMTVHQDAPRSWTAEDIALIEATAERLWSAVERAQVEATLRASEARFRTVVQHLPDYAIFMIDPAGRITGWWEGAEQVKGYSATEVLGQHLSLFYTREDVAAGVVAEELAIAARTGHYEGEGWRVRKGGERFWGNEIATAIRDDTGTLVGFTKISRDLTEWKAAEAALRQSETMLATVLEAAPVAIGFFDAQGQLLLANPALAYYLPSGTIPSRDPARLGRWSAYHPDGQPVAPEDFPGARAIRGLATIPGLEMRYRDDEERETWARVSSMPLQDANGQITGQVSVITDIEALKQTAETLQQRVDEATAELRTLSRRLLLVQEEERRRLALELHDEIGQVLTGLNLQLATAARGREDASLAAAQTTLSALTEQVRQLSLRLRPEVLDRYGLLAALEWHIQRFRANTGITVHVRHQGLDRRFPPEVEIAAYRVVQEALTNSARYAGVNEAWVTLFSDGSLLVVIHDQGQGFDATQPTDSSGLGGMRERVTLLGGTFVVDTAPGAGVHITAEFPLDDGAESHAIEEWLR